MHCRALPTHAYYRGRFGYEPERFPNAHFIGERTVSLPLSAKRSDEDVERIIATTRDLLAT